MRSRLALLAVLAAGATLLAAAAPAVGAATAATKVADHELVRSVMNPDGTIQRVELYDSLRIFGDGKVTVTDTVSPTHFRNLYGFAMPTLEGNQATWTLDVKGSKDITTYSTTDKTLPAVISIAYTKGGVEVPAKEFVGASGPVKLAITVSNQTIKTESLTFLDASGKTVVKDEPVATPLVAQVGAILDPAEWKNINAGDAAVVVDDEGVWHISWNLLLIPPTYQPTQTATITADGKNVTVPEIKVVVMPFSVASTLAEVTQQAETLRQLLAGAAAVDENLRKLKAGTDELVGGISQVGAGAGKAGAGVGSTTQPTTILGGLASVEAGMKTLAGTAGLGAAKTGIDQIVAGLAAAGPSLTQLSTGLAQLQGLVGTGSSTTVPSSTTSAQNDANVVKALVDGVFAALGMVPGAEGAFGSSLGQASAVLGTSVNPKLATLYSQLGTVKAGVDTLVAQLGTVTAGLRKVSAGLGTAIASLGTTSNATTLIGGTHKIRDGVTTLASGLSQLSAGIAQIKSGAQTVADSLAALAEKGSGKILEAVGSTTVLATEGTALAAAMERRAQATTSFAGAPEGAESGVAFAYTLAAQDRHVPETAGRAAAVGLMLMVLIGLGTLARRFI
ncbi:MAG: hypothetical protein WDA71_13695 [Actinomycetota bacterium]